MVKESNLCSRPYTIFKYLKNILKIKKIMFKFLEYICYKNV